jgi:hypothetical protein
MYPARLNTPLITAVDLEYSMLPPLRDESCERTLHEETGYSFGTPLTGFVATYMPEEENWRIGEWSIGDWSIGALEHWNIGEFENSRIGALEHSDIRACMMVLDMSRQIVHVVM